MTEMKWMAFILSDMMSVFSRDFLIAIKFSVVLATSRLFFLLDISCAVWWCLSWFKPCANIFMHFHIIRPSLASRCIAIIFIVFVFRFIAFHSLNRQKKTLMSQTFGKSKMPHFLFLITAWHWIRFVSFVLAYDMFNLCAFQLAGRFFSHLNIFILVLYIQLFSSYDYMIFFFWFTWFAQTKLIISRKKGEYIILLYIYICEWYVSVQLKRAYTIPLRMGYCPTPYDLVVLFHKWKRL